MRNIASTSVDKIDAEELIKEFKVTKIETFSSYLKEVWRVNNIILMFFI
jgi:hypothetical protein